MKALRSGFVSIAIIILLVESANLDNGSVSKCPVIVDDSTRLFVSEPRGVECWPVLQLWSLSRGNLTYLD